MVKPYITLTEEENSVLFRLIFIANSYTVIAKVSNRSEIWEKANWMTNAANLYMWELLDQYNVKINCLGHTSIDVDNKRIYY